MGLLGKGTDLVDLPDIPGIDIPDFGNTHTLPPAPAPPPPPPPALRRPPAMAPPPPPPPPA